MKNKKLLLNEIKITADHLLDINDEMLHQGIKTKKDEDARYFTVIAYEYLQLAIKNLH